MLEVFTKKGKGFTHQSFSKKNLGGFTLIELLVVIAIIGLLASIVLVAVGPARAKARDARRQSDMRQIMLAMEMCLDDSACGAKEQYVKKTTMLTNIDEDSTPCYLCPVPQDPSGGAYGWIDNTGDGTKFCVFDQLESPTTDTWVAASHKGTCFTLIAAPTALDCWTTCP